MTYKCFICSEVVDSSDDYIPHIRIMDYDCNHCSDDYIRICWNCFKQQAPIEIIDKLNQTRQKYNKEKM